MNTEKKTMTLNLPAHEMEILDQMCEAKDMSKTAVIRQALRLYQHIDTRISKGQKMSWKNPDGTSADVVFATMGCGWAGMD